MRHRWIKSLITDAILSDVRCICRTNCRTTRSIRFLFEKSHRIRFETKFGFGPDQSIPTAPITIKITNWILVSSIVPDFQFFTLISYVRSLFRHFQNSQAVRMVADIKRYGKMWISTISLDSEKDDETPSSSFSRKLEIHQINNSIYRSLNRCQIKHSHE